MRVLLIVNDPNLVAAQPYLTLKPGDEIVQIAPSSDNLEQIRQMRPDLVLVDPEMQEIRAQDLAALVHDDLSLRDIPVMLAPGLETGTASSTAEPGPAGQAGEAPPPAQISDTPHGLSAQWGSDCSSLERQILDSLDQAVVVTGLDGTIVYWNRFAEDLYGIPADKALTHTSYEVLGRRSRFYHDQVLPHLKSGKRWTMEYYVRGHDGRMRPVLLTVAPLFDAQGELIGITEIATDISERKENDSRYQRALFNAPFPVVIHAEDGEVIMINRAWTELSGFEPGHMPRMEDWVEKAYPANQRDEGLEKIHQQFRSDERVVDGGEAEVRTLRGRQRTWRFSSAPLGRTLDGRRTMISMAVDLTDRKEAEDRLQSAISDAPFPVMIHTEDGEVVLINRLWQELTGYAPEDIPTMDDWLQKAYGERLAAVTEHIGSQYESNRRINFDDNFVIDTKDGRQRIWNFSSAPLGHAPDGRQLVMVSAVDVTDRREIEKRFENAVLNSPFPAAMFVEDGEILMVNATWTRLSGYQHADIPTIAKWVEFAHGERQQLALDAIRRGFEAEGDDHGGEFVINTRDGAQRVWDISSVGLGNLPDGRRYRLIMAADITDRVEVEQRFRRSIDASPYPIVLYTEDGEMLMVSQSWTEITGFSLEDIPTLEIWMEKAYGAEKETNLARVRKAIAIDERVNLGEFLVTTKSGGQRLWEISTVSPGRLPDGRRIRMSIAVDLTERREVEQRFELAVQNAPFPLAIYADDGEFLLLNQAFQEYSGYGLADLPDLKTWLDKALRLRYPLIEEWVHRMQAEDGRVHKGEFAICTSDGRERVWDIDGVWLGRLPDGRRLRMIMAVDLTDRKEMEQRFALAVRYAPFPLSIYTEDGEMLLVNQSFTDQTGYTLLDLPRLSDYLSKTQRSSQPDTGPVSQARLEIGLPEVPGGAELYDALTSGTLDQDEPGTAQPDWSGELTIQTRDGRQRLWDTIAVPIGHLPDGRRLHMSMAADITERQQVELRFARAVEHAPYPLALVAEDGEMLSINQAFTRYSGYTLEDVPTLNTWLEKAYKHQRAEIEEQLQQDMKLGKPSSGEYIITARDGRQRIWETNGVPLGQLADGRKIRMAVSVDVTERREVEQRFERAVDNAPFPAIIHAEDGQMLLLNQAFQRTSGYTPEEMPTLAAYAELAFGEHKDAALVAALSGYEKGGLLKGGEFILITKSGRRRTWDFMSADLGRLADGRRTRLAMASDVTERKEAEERLRRAVEDAPFPIMIHAEGGEIISVNRTWVELTGYAQQDLTTINDWFDKAYGKRGAAVLAETRRTIPNLYETQSRVNYPNDFTIQTKDGRQVVWNFSSAPLGEMPDGRRLLISMAADVTERKRFEEALRESESKYRSLVESSNLGILVYQDRKIVYVNSAFAGLLELHPQEIDGRKLEDMAVYVDAADQQMAIENILQVEQGVLPTAFFEVRMRTASGKLCWAEASLHPIEYQGRRAIQSLLVDISDRKKAEDALSESESRYRQVVELSNMLIATIAAGQVVYINSAGAHLLGFDSAEEVLGLGLSELVHPDSYRRLVQVAQDMHLKELLARSPELLSESATFIEEEITLRNGSRVVLGASLNFLSVGDQPTVHIIAHDFTLRRRAREALRRQAALAQIDLAISRPEELATGLERVVEIACQTLEIQLGVVVVLSDPQSRALRLGASSLAEQHTAVLDRLLKAEESLSAFILEEKKPWVVQDAADDLYDPAYFAGTPVQAYAAIPVMVENRARAVLYLFEDRPFSIEHDSLEFMEALAYRLAMAIAKVDLYEGIRNARDAAEEASQAKASFLANISHELRTPLTTITTLAELLLDSHLDAVQSNYSQTILNSAGRLLDLINHVLHFSRLEAHKQSLAQQRFDLRRCIESALDLVAVNAATKGLGLEYFAAPNLPTQVLGDTLQLGQVLTNLLSNAIKFTETGFVSLTVSQVPGAEIGPGGVREFLFTVQDTGIGIAPERIPLLFQPFSQVDTSPTRKYSGTGLGLVISKQIVDLMDGRIWVESDGRSGSSFFFTVKLPVVDEQLAPYLQPDQPVMLGKTVMILTQSSQARKVLQEWTTHWGCKPRVFFQPAQALQWLQAGSRPDLVLADHIYLTASASEDDLFAVLNSLAVASWLDADAPDADSSGAESSGADASGAESSGSARVHLAALVPFSQKYTIPAALSSLPTNPVKPGTLYSLLASLFTRALDPVPETFDFPEHNRLNEQNLRVLLAEDDPLNRQALTLRLQRLGYAVDAVVNGLEVIQAIASGRYEIVFMDYQMPEMDGLNTIRYIRSNYPTDRQPYVIGLTADARQEARDALLAAGANLYLTKPVKGDDLALALSQALDYFRTTHRASSLSNWVAWSTQQQAVDPIDEAVFRELAEAVGGQDMENLLIILELFFENSQKLTQAIQADVRESSWQQLRHDLHTLKGSTELLGAIAFGKQCKRLELTVADGQTEDIAQQIAALLAAYAEVRKALEERYQQILARTRPSRQPEGEL